MFVLDLSHTLETGMQIYPGDPEVAISKGLVHQEEYCHVDRLNIGSHSGTHIDAPYHFLEDGRRIDQFPADYFIGRGVVISLPEKKGNEPIAMSELIPWEEQLKKGTIALLCTGWDAYFGLPEYLSHPYLSREAAEFLVACGVKIVGTDALNIDSSINGEFPAHDVLLSREVLIVENLKGLGEIPDKHSGLFSFLPLKIKNSDGSPVRAVYIEA